MALAFNPFLSLYSTSRSTIKKTFEVVLKPFSIPGGLRPTNDANIAHVANIDITIRSVPASHASPQDQSLRARAMQELSVIVLTLISWILPVCLVLGTTLLVLILYKKRYVNGLLLGAAFSGGVYASVESNPSSSTPLLVAVLIGYLVFHITYCYTVIITLRLGELFVTFTAMIAMFFLTTLSLVSELPVLWKDSTGLAGIWSCFPLHLIVFFLGALAVKHVRNYIRYDGESTTARLLPMTVQDVNHATSTSRSDEALEHRTRIPANSDVVPSS